MLHKTITNRSEGKMYNIKLYDYVPEPKPVTSNIIVCAHYYAAWKKGAAELHNGFNDLHNYPERTPLMGYYDEESPEVCDWEIKWASEHGINCFIHCWYRKKNNCGKTVTVKDLRCGHGLHEALFNARYQKYMDFAIMFEATNRWGATDSNDIIENLMPFWYDNYFSRNNYLKVDGKPVLFVYDTDDQIKNNFESAAEQKKAFDACRRFMEKKGYPGMIFALNKRHAEKDELEDIYARGYDFRFTYNYWRNGNGIVPSEEEVVEDQKCKLSEEFLIDSKRFIATASVFWDPTPRLSEAWVNKGYHYSDKNTWYLSPESFRKLLHDFKKMTDVLPKNAYGKKLMMIDNWNEWDEGHFVSPSHSHGFKYLQAIREELTQRNNLPDYRMPQDICPSDLGKSWDVPDFTGVNRKDFYVTD